MPPNPTPIPVGTRVFLHDNPNASPLPGCVTALEVMGNGTQLARLLLDNGKNLTVPVSLLEVAPAT
ncbi:hypothetical protein FRB94_003869 [Tulasnella sp. JGI-2019a]|nr:hypothetical protein FRB93_013173 [Tulasnella sp. JGI-2019a]KAG9002458.1 hypothetical protein FRB94_003869 [Tulasnella sp. JGI-2019a]KAG9034719.1 hypothetical protein FRB95_012669 [Tulasnella sp. JGI-2019a]